MARRIGEIALCIMILIALVRCGEDLLDPPVFEDLDTFLMLRDMDDLTFVDDTSGVRFKIENPCEKINIISDTFYTETITMDTLENDSIIFDTIEVENIVFDTMIDFSDCPALFEDSAITLVAHRQRSMLTDMTTVSETNMGEVDTVEFDNFVSGIRRTLPFVRKGQKVTIYIPSDEAFGSRGNTNVPPNADMIIDFELIDFWVEEVVDTLQ